MQLTERICKNKMDTITVLEFDIIINKLKEYAISQGAKEKLSDLAPYTKESEVIRRTQETTEARKLLDGLGTPPLSEMKNLAENLELAVKGGMLTCEQLTSFAQYGKALKRLISYLGRAEDFNSALAGYGASMTDIDYLAEEIDAAVRGGRIEDEASKELKEIRRKIETAGNQIRTRLEQMLKNHREYYSESFVAVRNGRLVLPVKKEYKHQVGGSVLDISASGATCFIEPSSASRLQEELSILKIAEINEENRILYTLTSLVADSADIIRADMEIMEDLDVIFARGKLSVDMKAVPAAIHTNRYIKIEKGRHPLLGKEGLVPLDFEIGNGVRGIIITGPNTGGKTVSLKTVGLFCLMAQSGLHVPCESASIGMNNAVFCDIGDGQSITENLSTFSAHLTNIISILKRSDAGSLVLLDELGSGTDPAEGMGIAVAVLEELKNKGCLFAATTHYPEVKEYAKEAEGLINARMAFDRESLKPLYRLEIGEAGESCALYIAKRLGLPQRMLKAAYDMAYGVGNGAGGGLLTERRNSLKEEEKRSLFDSGEDADGGNRISQEKEEAGGQGLLPQVEKMEEPKERNKNKKYSDKFQIGDSVLVYPQKKIGIVFSKINENGEIGVQIQKRKQWISHKRLKLKAPASEMYPEGYDFSIVFDTVENRKARHEMGKRMTDRAVVYQAGEEWSK